MAGSPCGPSPTIHSSSSSSAVRAGTSACALLRRRCLRRRDAHAAGRRSQGLSAPGSRPRLRRHVLRGGLLGGYERRGEVHSARAGGRRDGGEAHAARRDAPQCAALLHLRLGRLAGVPGAGALRLQPRASGGARASGGGVGARRALGGGDAGGARDGGGHRGAAPPRRGASRLEAPQCAAGRGGGSRRRAGGQDIGPGAVQAPGGRAELLRDGPRGRHSRLAGAGAAAAAARRSVPHEEAHGHLLARLPALLLLDGRRAPLPGAGPRAAEQHASRPGGPVGAEAPAAAPGSGRKHAGGGPGRPAAHGGGAGAPGVVGAQGAAAVPVPPERLPGRPRTGRAAQGAAQHGGRVRAGRRRRLDGHVGRQRP
mmetsp:Transcript_4383/g.11255  ORF Transcript_4383/g.11255 Transcript_4383/m.11255 type:complete len:369 (+) Transcript_4383:585-1691(+)